APAHPRNAVIGIPFEGVRAIRSQRAARRSPIGVVLEEGFVKCAAVVRSVPAPAPVRQVGAGESRVVPTKAAVRIGEHPVPALARSLGYAYLQAVVAACRLDVWRAPERGLRAGVGQIVSVRTESRVDDQEVLTPGGIENGGVFDRAIKTTTIPTGLHC